MISYFNHGSLQRKFLFSFCIIHISFSSQSQNLVVNSGFESFTTCPVGFSQYNGFVKNWVNPSAASPDYYNACANPNPAGIPQNGTGFQYAHGGNACSGMYTTSGTYREYVQVQLSSPLLANNAYTFSMYVVLHNKSKWATDDIGAYFSVTAPTSAGTGFLNGNPVAQVNNSPGNVITDSLNWVLISGSFTAAGGEQYVTIGHFKTDAFSTYLQVNYGNQGAYYYIDDVSLIPSIPLPVELIDFSAHANSNSIDLKWTTASEVNNDHFIVQRSVNGKDFFDIGSVKGHGNSNEINNYSFTDRNVFPGQLYYYRLMQTDFDGYFSSSKTVSAMIKGSGEFVKFIITDFTDKISIELNNENYAPVIVELKDVSGKIVMKNEYKNTFKLIEISTSPLSKGIYFLSFSSGNQFVRRRILKL